MSRYFDEQETIGREKGKEVMGRPCASWRSGYRRMT